MPLLERGKLETVPLVVSGALLAYRGGQLCDRRCRIAERYGMWTLIITLGIPIAVVIWILVRLTG